jgi:hypothetical protein
MFSRIRDYLNRAVWLCKKQNTLPATTNTDDVLKDIEGTELDVLSGNDAVTESDWRFISSCLNYGERRGREKLDD